jgi:hypothetical protein
MEVIGDDSKCDPHGQDAPFDGWEVTNNIQAAVGQKQ